MEHTNVMPRSNQRKLSYIFRGLISPLKKLVFPDRFAKRAIVPLRVSCAISK